MIERSHDIAVPLDQETYAKWKSAGTTGGNQLKWQFPRADFNWLFHNNLFFVIEPFCDGMMTDYESSWIEGAENLRQARAALADLAPKLGGEPLFQKMVSMIDKAIECETVITFDL